MFGLVPQGPWIEPLNWNIYATPVGEVCIPFHLYVDPKQITSSRSTFHSFLRIPSELQLHVLHFCDAATLFQLMHVSSATRHEAQKLFWSKPETWFRVDANWVLRGGYSGHTLDSTDALSYMKQIEVEFGGILPFHQINKDNPYTCEEQPPDHMMIRTFWRTLAMRFPCATDIVLSRDCPLEHAPRGMKAAAESCPEGILASVPFKKYHSGHKYLLERSVWRPVNTSGDAHTVSEVVDPSLTRQIVRPPPKMFRGPVGAYFRSRHLFNTRFSLQYARRVIMLQATITHHLDRQLPCICPIPECGLQFEQPSQWAIHAIDTEHEEESTAPNESLKILLKDHLAREESKHKEYEDAMTNMRTAWGKEGSEERREAKNAFLYQMMHDALYTPERPMEESLVWQQYEQEMNEEEVLGYLI